jgi:ribA/ribD-fused uncharacterized protein
MKCRAWTEEYGFIHVSSIDLCNVEAYGLPYDIQDSVAVPLSAIERDTGLLDINGTPIFEGDVVEEWVDLGPAGETQAITAVKIGTWGANLEPWAFKETGYLPKIIGHLHEPAIVEFKDEYCWLSNFWPAPIIWEGRTYPSAEHAYQASKSDDPVWKETCATTESPGMIKKMSRLIRIKPDWDLIKIQTMRKILEIKFQHPDLKKKLRYTHFRLLFEGNNWGDTFWGVDLKTFKGTNTLGIILSEIRKSI